MSESDTAAVCSSIVDGGWGLGLLLGFLVAWILDRREMNRAFREAEEAEAIYSEFVRRAGK